MRELFILMSGDESMAKQFRIINDKGDYHILDGDDADIAEMINEYLKEEGD